MEIKVVRKWNCYEDHYKWYSNLKFDVKDKNNYNHTLWFNLSPTSNCQVASISPMCVVLDNFTREEFIAMLNALNPIPQWRQLQLLVDIYQNKKELLRKMFPDEIVMLNDYKSTNGTPMCLGLIDVRNLK